MKRLKVSRRIITSSRFRRQETVSLLRFGGKWIGVALGICPGDFVTIEKRAGALIIRKEAKHV